MTNDEFKAHITWLRRFGPTWANLRSIGNSRPVQIATVFPVVGYFILLSTQVTHFVDGGIAGPDAHADPLARLWALKLYFLYFGLIALGIGSAIYQWRCPRIVKSFGDSSEYVRVQGNAISGAQLRFMGGETIPYEGMVEGDYVRPEYRIPVMTNYYALESHRRPASRLATTISFTAGFGLLAIPSIMTFFKVFRLLFAQM